MRPVFRKLPVLILGFWVLCWLLPEGALARPGGGQAYRGSSSAPSSGGSGWGSSGSSKSSSGHSSWGSSGSSSQSSSSNKSSSGGSWFSSTPSRDSSWSSTPSYSAPWSQPSPPSNYSPGKGSYSSPRYRQPTNSGAATEFYFWFIALFIAAAVVVAVSMLAKARAQRAWASGLGSGGELAGLFADVEREHESVVGMRRRHASIEEALGDIGSSDQDFSYSVFQDFASALFVEVHQARGSGSLSRVSPYLSEAVRKQLETRSVANVTDVLVGAMTVEVVGSDTNGALTIKLRFSANLTENSDGTDQALYLEELWTLEREAGATSRPPSRASTIDCPMCGAELDGEIGVRCRYCDQVFRSGKFDWAVTAIEICERTSRPPMLTGSVEEVGTDLPTVEAPGTRKRFAELCKRDPEFRWPALLQRVELIFKTFHRTWTAQDLSEVRPFLSDSLMSLQRYWIAAYKAQGLRNITQDATIVLVHVAKVVQDKHFDAITLRVYASCVDYTLDAAGICVGGNMKKVRNYTEYWTLLRSRNTNGPPKLDPGCPNCGASIEHINMAGDCGSCGKRVTSGEFDWVLSRIEQDESYRG